MRKMTLLIMLLLILSILTGCAPHPDLVGRWETSAEETMCATILWLNGDNTFEHIQEGRTAEGTWTLKGNTLTMRAGDGSTFSYALDQALGCLSMGDGLHLYRQPDPDVIGYWMSMDDDLPGHTSLHLMAHGYFYQEISHWDAIDVITLDAGDRMDGSWSLSGQVLTLRCSDDSILTYRLTPDGTGINTGNGDQLTKMWEPD